MKLQGRVFPSTKIRKSTTTTTTGLARITIECMASRTRKETSRRIRMSLETNKRLGREHVQHEVALVLDLFGQPDAGVKLTVLPVEASTALDDSRFFIQP